MERTTMRFDRIILSTDNPRLDASFSEDEAIQKMIEDQKEKIFELASDIVAYGLNPLELVAVFPSEIYPGFYEVAEGNRRVCALKLLAKPELIKERYPWLFAKFNVLSADWNAPDTVEVVVFDTEEKTHHWMEIRHMGEQGGKGLSKWNSVQKMRYQKSQTGADALLDFWTWMDESGILSMHQILDVTKTNWQRILREAYYPFLKLWYDGRYYVRDEDIPTFSERIIAIQQKLAGQTVGIVYDQPRIEKFYNDLSIELYGLPYGEVVDHEAKTQQLSIDIESEKKTQQDCDYSWKPGKANSDEADSTVQPEENAELVLHPNIASHSFSERDIFIGSTTIIPRGYQISSKNMRLNKIISELKRLNPDEYPNACGALLRTLFELSAKVYLEGLTGNDMTESQFQQVICDAANRLRASGEISNSEHSAIVKDINNLRLIFNGYMHNTDAYPSSLALKNLFKAHVKFIQECLK